MKNIKEINKIVRLGDIKRIERAGNIAHYEQIEVTSADIATKSEKVGELKEQLVKLLFYIGMEYSNLSYDKENDIKKKIDLLVDIEEIIKTIGRLDGKGWEAVWHQAKMSSMQGFARYSRIGLPDLRGCITEYWAYDDYDDLCYIESALFNELKKLNVDYIKFQDKRMLKKKSLGGFRDGYVLKGIEYVDTQGQKLNK